MNFIIIFEIILTCVLSKVVDVVDSSGQNVDLNPVNNKSSLTFQQSSEKEYCKCEFKNPLLVLGKSFDQTYMMKMCEMQVIGHSSVVKHVKFTSVGSRICDTVCKKCINNIKEQNKKKNLRIILMENYCDMIDKESESPTNLATQCVCVYHIQSNSTWQTVIVYKLHVNFHGLVSIQSN